MLQYYTSDNRLVFYIDTFTRVELQNLIISLVVTIGCGMVHNNNYVQDILPYVTSTLIKTLLNPMWKLPFGTQVIGL